jgi:hypothetical protein
MRWRYRRWFLYCVKYCYGISFVGMLLLIAANQVSSSPLREVAFVLGTIPLCTGGGLHYIRGIRGRRKAKAF